ncbi:caspase family protein [Methylobacterium sp. CM6247]
MARKALIVGIDYYASIEGLTGCVNDAHAVKAALDRNADGSVNFGTRLLVSTGPGEMVTRKQLKQAVEDLFSDKGELALLYFAGHGYIEATGGFLCASDCETGDDGFPLSEIMLFANKSNASNRIIILDSCHSGAIGDRAIIPQVSEIAEGVTILTASTKKQYAAEENGGGVFTGLLIDALYGAAANLIGKVTPGSVYAHIDQSLGEWNQRPVFKTNVETFVSLRQVQAPLELADLHRIAEFFPEPGFEFHLDPSYEPTEETADPDKNEIFAILQKYNRVNLLVPIAEKHMYYAALHSKSCKLTSLGEHYRRLANEGLV